MVEGIMLLPPTGTPPPQVLHGLTDAHGWHPGALQGCIVAGAAARGGNCTVRCETRRQMTETFLVLPDFKFYVPF